MRAKPVHGWPITSGFHEMHIWVDGDACPRPVKDILLRAATRTGTRMTFVANTYLALSSDQVDVLVVAAGPDAADDAIADACSPGDLVVTADIPLAARAVGKGAMALDPRGRLYTPDNIKEILAMRDLMDSLRGSGIDGGGPAAFGVREKNLFANHLDRLIAAAQRG